ncbi:hypothetical protein DRN67_01595, partial [Candidatus Micrarchaeota archaeon]
MFMQGRGFEAIRICSFSFILSSLLALLLFPLSLLLFPLFYQLIAPQMHHALMLLSLFLLASESKLHKIASALLCFLFSGLLGIILFTYPVVTEPLFPSFAGLFAISGLVLSMFDKPKTPAQTDSSPRLLPLLPVIFIGTLLAGLSD